MEQLNSGESKTIFRNIYCIVIVGLTTSGRAGRRQTRDDKGNLGSVKAVLNRFQKLKTRHISCQTQEHHGAHHVAQGAPGILEHIA